MSAPVIALATEAAKAGDYPQKLNKREQKLAEAAKTYVDAIETARLAAQLTNKFVQAEIDFATAGNRTAADHSLGVTIPAGAVVINVLTKVTADLSSTSSDTIQLFLGASSGGLSISAAITADGSTAQGWTVEGATACPGRTAASASLLTVKVTDHAITSTSGKVQYIVEYIIPV
jgi:hypothetical protein